MTRLIRADCLDALRGLPDNSVDAVVTDPPYGLRFMGKKWDYDVPSEEIWRECLRVLKPGGHLLAFAGTRTQHRMAVRIEDAGFEIRDMIAWVYGSGFPKSLDVSKAIDKAAGVEREVVGVSPHSAKRESLTLATGHNAPSGYNANAEGERLLTAPATPAAQQWQGWGTALKPALEPITVARKPLAYTVAGNVQAFGTGALNIDACRVESGDPLVRPAVTRTDNAVLGKGLGAGVQVEPEGRWPANLIHDGSEEVLAGFPDTVARANKESDGRTVRGAGDSLQMGTAGIRTPDNSYSDSGNAARFFYCAKASKADRGEGNTHPTVKPTALMRYLCRLVTPAGGTVLDPFMGSGSTGKAARLEGFGFVGMERDADSFATAQRRIAATEAALTLGLFAQGAGSP